MSRIVSARWRANRGGVTRWATDIRWSNDWGRSWSDPHLTVSPVRLISGQCTSDATAQTRWSCQLELAGITVDLVNGVSPFQSWIKIKHGPQWSTNPADRELIGMGIYRVSSVKPSQQAPGQVTVTGVSTERYVIDDTFSSPVQLPAESSDRRINRLITQVLPAASLYWDPRVKSSTLLPNVIVERDRWAVIDGGADAGSIAKALSARVYTNGDGVFIIAPAPTLKDAPQWTATVGPGGLLIGSEETLTDEGVKNRCIVTGESTSGTAVGPVTVSDDDPYSLTYINGRFGKRPFYYTNQNITSLSQARAVGRTQLAAKLGLRQQVTFDSLHDPTKEAGDVGLVMTTRGLQRVILDSVTYDLTGGNLQCQTRTTAAVPGEQLDIPDDDGGSDA